MKDALQIFGNTPVTAKAIASLYPGISGVHQKVAALENTGSIIRLKRGLYIVNPDISGNRISTELVANHLYSPSYISMLSALRWYGLIPERVVITQSMTVKHSRSFTNTLGTFEYTCVNRDYFPIGLRQGKTDESTFIIAGPEKALSDLIANTAGLNLRYLRDVRHYLEDDLRLDMYEFKTFDREILEQCAKAGKKAGSIQMLIRLLEQ
ncbi:MAG: hypothetical protein LKI59_03950 [Bacteroidales bacterium]|jgi:hypothetical protein|nr:hypothetical protein [Bacteroidales bacterium]